MEEVGGSFGRSMSSVKICFDAITKTRNIGESVEESVGSEIVTDLAGLIITTASASSVSGVDEKATQ